MSEYDAPFGQALCSGELDILAVQRLDEGHAAIATPGPEGLRRQRDGRQS